MAGEVTGRVVFVIMSWPLMMIGTVWNDGFEGAVVSCPLVVTLDAMIANPEVGVIDAGVELKLNEDFWGG